MAIRFDRSTISNKQPFKTEDGTFLCEATLCRAGILEYKQPNGTVIKEFRPPEENERAIAEMGLLPVGIEHPTSLVNEDSARAYRKGISLQNVRLGKGGYVTADLAIFDSELQRMIEAGEKREVSLGYRCDVKDTPGVWTDEAGVEHRFDRVQTNIRPNHIAVTSKARAGETVRIHMDSDDEDFAIMITAEDLEPKSLETEGAARVDGSCKCEKGGECDCPNCKGKNKKGVPQMDGKMAKMKFDMGGGITQEYEMPKEVADAMCSKMDKYRKDSEELLEEVEHQDSVIEALEAQVEELATALENNTEVYDELRETFDSLVDELEEIRDEVERLDSEDDEDEDYDINELVDKVISDRLDAYEAVQHLIPGKEFDYRLDADEWAIAALEANGVELDDDERLDSGAIAIALKVLDQKLSRQDSTISLQQRLQQVRVDAAADERYDSEAARKRMLAQNDVYRTKRISELV